ncbi:MAG: beta-glucuronidase [Lachnospiraceae bacterium]|nr:beta-glucuronidase [Lachnospiraceae bacterium]
MAQVVQLKNEGLNVILEQNPFLLSYNVEMAEVTGGTFWKAYTPGQIAGTEPFEVDISGGLTAAYKDLMQVYPPIDLYNEKLRKLAKNFGELWVRVSGTWATKTYYDLDDSMGGKVPEGYLNTLTRKQLTGVLDFVKAMGAHLMTSVSACPGVYGVNEAPVPAWTPREAEKLFKFCADYGVPIEASEFVNEPNMLAETGFPQGYTAADHARDQKIFQKWLKENYPDCLYIGPCTVGAEGSLGRKSEKSGGVENLVGNTASTHALMGEDPAPLDVFVYHYYNGVSERLGGVMPQAHWLAEEANSEDYLAVAPDNARTYAPFRDQYCPGGEMWVTESGDAGGGGDTWASTYLDVLRTLNEAGGFSQVSRGIIFHNTLAASDYAYLDRVTHEPRPNYFAVLLWIRLMGTTVYETEPVRMGAHVYAHSRKDGKEGVAYLVINNSETDTTTVELPCDAQRYTLAGKDGNKRATVMTLNGKDLVLKEGNELPDMDPVLQPAGTVELAPMTCTFFVL